MQNKGTRESHEMRGGEGRINEELRRHPILVFFYCHNKVSYSRQCNKEQTYWDLVS